MRIAHLIMAHKAPQQLERLLRALAHPDFDFYIHLDQKANFEEFRYLAGLPNVYFLPKRFFIYWASYRFTKAILECTKAILATEIEYDFINLLSAQDYPIKSTEEIHRFYHNHLGTCFLSFEPHDSEWWQHARSRVEKYHTTYFNFKGQYLLQSCINRLLPKREFPLPYTLYGGMDGSWWTLTRECARNLVDFIDAHPGLQRFAVFTWGSDEFLLATIIMNSPFRHTVVNDNHRYIDWSEGGANPKVLTVNDLEALLASPKLFARKFDPSVDTEILDMLDKHIRPELHLQTA